jgi:hypothetical protein
VERADTVLARVERMMIVAMRRPDGDVVGRVTIS